MSCWVAMAPLMDSTTGWRHTDFTGRYPKTTRSPHRSITSAKAVKRSIVSPRARNRWQFPCVASGSDRFNSRPRDPEDRHEDDTGPPEYVTDGSVKRRHAADWCVGE